MVERAKGSEAGMGCGVLLFADGVEALQIGITEAAEWAGAVAEQLRMLFQEMPRCGAVSGSAAQQVVAVEGRMFVGGGDRWFEADAVAEPVQASAHFRVFGNAKGRVEVAGFQERLTADAE